MKKRIIAFILTVVMILILGQSAFADDDIPKSLPAPSSLFVRNDEGILRPTWTNPQSIITNLENSEYYSNLLYLFDWKLNDGNWNIGLLPDDPNYVDEIHGYFYAYMLNVMIDENGTSENFFVNWHFDPNALPDDVDLVSNTYTFRLRYVLTFYDGEFSPIYSPYSNEFSIGKNANVSKITKLDPPKDLMVEVKKDNNGKPYFQLNWIIPDSINEADKQFPVSHRIDFKVGNGPWLSETTSKDQLPSAPSGQLKSGDTFDPIEKEFVDDIVIEENTYYFRVLFEGEVTTSNSIYSEYSNVVSTKMQAYSNASSWAKPELDKAVEYNLIPASLKGADMTKPITREEFAEVAVKLYEKTTGKNAIPVGKNSFTDTNNPEVLKAFNLGITTGVAVDKFAPKDLINREQVATMLSRAIKTMVPNADFSIEGAPTFTDEHFISSWALEHVKYMSKNEIIKGSDGKFMPKATTSAEIATGYANTTREQAILMGVRTFEKYGIN